MNFALFAMVAVILGTSNSAVSRHDIESGILSSPPSVCDVMIKHGFRTVAYELDSTHFLPNGTSQHVWERLTVDGKEIFHVTDEMKAWYAPGWNASRILSLINCALRPTPRDCSTKTHCS